MQKLYDRKNIGKVLLDPGKEPLQKVGLCKVLFDPGKEPLQKVGLCAWNMPRENNEEINSATFSVPKLQLNYCCHVSL